MKDGDDEKNCVKPTFLGKRFCADIADKVLVRYSVTSVGVGD